MVFNSTALIEDLTQRTFLIVNDAKELKFLTTEQLNAKLNANSWSVLECIEHLNLYGDYYLPELEKQIRESETVFDPQFKSGWLGNYFANSMLPKKGMQKMRTFKDKNPINSRLDISVIDRFINQQNQMLQLLDKARNVSLTKVKTRISISNLMRLRLGDTFRFVIYHNERHLVQAKNVLKVI